MYAEPSTVISVQPACAGKPSSIAVAIMIANEVSAITQNSVRCQKG